MAIFRIADGDPPDIFISNSIWCKRTPDTPVGWVDSNDTEPGEFEDTFFRDVNWVWVQVDQEDAVLSDQDAFLHLFARLTWPTRSCCLPTSSHR